MTTFRYSITAADAGDEIQHFLRFKQGISRKVVIPSNTCRREFC